MVVRTRSVLVSPAYVYRLCILTDVEDWKVVTASVSVRLSALQSALLKATAPPCRLPAISGPGDQPHGRPLASHMTVTYCTAAEVPGERWN